MVFTKGLDVDYNGIELEVEIMSNIWDSIQFTPSERPKYTRFELGKIVREKREERQLTLEAVAAQFNVSADLWKSIEDASRALNVRTYKLISAFLGITLEQLLEKETDNLAVISFRATDTNPEINEAIQVANLIFDEMVMQEKFSSH